MEPRAHDGTVPQSDILNVHIYSYASQKKHSTNHQPYGRFTHLWRPWRVKICCHSPRLVSSLNICTMSKFKHKPSLTQWCDYEWDLGGKGGGAGGDRLKFHQYPLDLSPSSRFFLMIKHKLGLQHHNSVHKICLSSHHFLKLWNVCGIFGLTIKLCPFVRNPNPQKATTMS